MEKEFVDYTEALELKELGFDEPCFGYYNSNGEFKTKQDEYELYLICNSKWISPACSAPTWQSAFRFFREKYDLHYAILFCNSKKSYDFIYGERIEGSMLGTSQIYEEAELECLKKLIQIVKEKL
jgi:hypothetical protein